LRVQTYDKIAQNKADNPCQYKQPGQETFLFEKQENAKTDEKCSKYE